MTAAGRRLRGAVALACAVLAAIVAVAPAGGHGAARCAPGPGAACRGANLRAAHLAGRNLSRADLRWANLRGADLRGANLRRARLAHADLRKALLGPRPTHHPKASNGIACSPQCAGAQLQGAQLQGVNLSGADLDHANLGGANFTEADFTGASMVSTSGQGATGQDAIFTSANMFETVLANATLDGAAFADEMGMAPPATLNSIDISGSSCLRCYFGGIAQFEPSNFTYANLTGAYFTGWLTTMQSPMFTGANLTGASFQGTYVPDAQSNGVVWSSTTCTNGLMAPQQQAACF